MTHWSCLGRVKDTVCWFGILKGDTGAFWDILRLQQEYSGALYDTVDWFETCQGFCLANRRALNPVIPDTVETSETGRERTQEEGKPWGKPRRERA